MSKLLAWISVYIKDMLVQRKRFTGRLELNFKDGKLKDVNETKRTKYPEEGD